MIAHRLAALFCLIAIAGQAFAAELPFSEIYGNTAGCALAQRVPNAPAGLGTAISGGFVIHKRERCEITSVAEDQPGAVWRVGISCASGHDGETAAVLALAREADKSALRVSLVSGDGPAGRLALCPAR